MKTWAIGLVCLLSSAAIAATPASALRVAYVDLQRALQTVDAGKKAKNDLEKEVAAKTRAA